MIVKALILFCLSVTPLIAGDFPPGWPWRSVVIHAHTLSKEPEMLNEVLHSNINVVKIYMQIKLTMELNNLAADQALQLNLDNIDKITGLLSKNNIGIVVDLSDFPTDSGKCSDKIKIDYWLDESCINQIYDLTEKTIKHFAKSGDSVIAFQIFSEPVVVNWLGQNEQPSDWMQIYKNIIKIVRKYDEKRFLIFSTGPWGEPMGYQNVEPFDDKKIIYNFHMYKPHGFTHQGIRGNKDNRSYPGFLGFKYWNKDALNQYILPIIHFQKKYHVPVSVCEFSAVRWAPGRDDYLRDIIDIFEDNNFSWFYFSLGGTWKGWDPRFEADAKGKNLTRHDLNSSKTWTLLTNYFAKNKKEIK
ncbi:MAG: cellulase family glycosylhydrolase [Methylococcales bacterium]|nr:cellulase family glycosylhydrolase [Methylococcales bacterium]